MCPNPRWSALPDIAVTVIRRLSRNGSSSELGFSKRNGAAEDDGHLWLEVGVPRDHRLDVLLRKRSPLAAALAITVGGLSASVGAELDIGAERVADDLFAPLAPDHRVRHYVEPL